MVTIITNKIVKRLLEVDFSPSLLFLKIKVVINLRIKSPSALVLIKVTTDLYLGQTIFKLNKTQN